MSNSLRPVDCSLPGSSIHGILQARILEWVAICFSRGSSQPRDRIWVSHIGGRCFNLWAGLGGMAPSCSMEHQSGQLTEGWGTLFPDGSLTRPAPCCWRSPGAQLGLRGGSPQILSRWSPACACGHPHSTVVFSKGEHHKRETQAEAICLLWPNLGCHTFFSVFCSLKLAQRLTCSGGRDIEFTS